MGFSEDEDYGECMIIHGVLSYGDDEGKDNEDEKANKIGRGERQIPSRTKR